MTFTSVEGSAAGLQQPGGGNIQTVGVPSMPAEATSASANGTEPEASDQIDRLDKDAVHRQTKEYKC